MFEMSLVEAGADSWRLPFNPPLLFNARLDSHCRWITFRGAGRRQLHPSKSSEIATPRTQSSAAEVA